jgi:hypothetical protein
MQSSSVMVPAYQSNAQYTIQQVLPLRTTIKYTLFYFFLLTSIALWVAATVESFSPFFPAHTCNVDLINTVKAFCILSIVAAGAAVVFAPMSCTLPPMRHSHTAPAIAAFAFSIIPWAILASLWNDTCKDTIPNFGDEFMGLFVTGTGTALLAWIIDVAIPDPVPMTQAQQANAAGQPDMVNYSHNLTHGAGVYQAQPVVVAHQQPTIVTTHSTYA